MDLGHGRRYKGQRATGNHRHSEKENLLRNFNWWFRLIDECWNLIRIDLRNFTQRFADEKYQCKLYSEAAEDKLDGNWWDSRWPDLLNRCSGIWCFTSRFLLVLNAFFNIKVCSMYDSLLMAISRSKFRRCKQVARKLVCRPCDRGSLTIN